MAPLASMGITRVLLTFCGIIIPQGMFFTQMPLRVMRKAFFALMTEVILLFATNMNCSICNSLTPNETSICDSCEYLDDNKFKPNGAGIMECYAALHQAKNGDQWIMAWPSPGLACKESEGVSSQIIKTCLRKSLVIPCGKPTVVSQWSESPPTKAGFWWRKPHAQHRPVVVEITENDIAAHSFPKGGLWAGPIVQPTE